MSDPNVTPQGIPAIWKVGALRYRVIAWPEPQAEAVQAYGECDRVGQTIKLRESLRPARAADALVHELLHAIWTDRSVGGSNALEERAVDALASGLVAILADNRGTGALLDRLVAAEWDGEE